jgi:hypothetical protein
MPLQTTATYKTRGPASRRAELLADRIEEGAAGLAAFAEGLSEAEWLEPGIRYGPSPGWRHRASCCQYVSDRD